MLLYKSGPVDKDAPRPMLPLLSTAETARKLKGWQWRLFLEQLKPVNLFNAFKPSTLIACGLSSPLVATAIPYNEYYHVRRSAFRAAFVGFYEWLQHTQTSENPPTREDIETGRQDMIRISQIKSSVIQTWRQNIFEKLGYPHLNDHIASQTIRLLAYEAKFRRLLQSRELKLDRDTDACLLFALNNMPDHKLHLPFLSGVIEAAGTFSDYLARFLDAHDKAAHRPITAPELEVILARIRKSNTASAYGSRHETIATNLIYLLGSQPFTLTYDDKGMLTAITDNPLKPEELEKILKDPKIKKIYDGQMDNPISTGCPVIHAKIKDAKYNNLVNLTLAAYENAVRTSILDPSRPAAFAAVYNRPRKNYRKPLPMRPEHASTSAPGRCPFHHTAN